MMIYEVGILSLKHEIMEISYSKPFPLRVELYIDG